MKKLADIAIALADLAEAEGRLLRRNIIRLGNSLILVAVSILLAAAGAGMMLWALYQSLTAATGPAMGAFLTGLAGLVGAGVLSWIASQKNR